MATGPYVVVGRVTKTHGLKGEVSVAPAAGTSFELLEGVGVWFVPPPRHLRSARTTAVRAVHKGVLVSFEGVSSIDLSASLVGCDILVEADSVPEGWQPDIAHTHDGFRVFDSKHGQLGTVSETIVTGANDVWVVHGPLGEILVPVIDDVVSEIDTAEREIRVTLLPGLVAEDST